MIIAVFWYCISERQNIQGIMLCNFASCIVIENIMDDGMKI